MTDRTLYLAWQDKRLTRAWFPVGRLDVSRGTGAYRFRYIRGAQRAREQAGFAPLMDFPEWKKTYESAVLFPLFMNRVIPTGRGDFANYLRMLDLPEGSEPADIMEVDGGHRATDSFEVFPQIELGEDGMFRSRFFLHGARHVNVPAQQRIDSLAPDERLIVSIELNNPASGMAVQIQTGDYHVLGWAPRYLVDDLVRAIAVSSSGFAAKVVRVNPAPAPSKQRLLVELSGKWPDYEPMSQGDFEAIAND